MALKDLNPVFLERLAKIDGFDKYVYGAMVDLSEKGVRTVLLPNILAQLKDSCIDVKNPNDVEASLHKLAVEGYLREMPPRRSVHTSFRFYILRE
jgi:hypothetical protein